MLPEMATASAILLPRSSLGKSCRLQKHGSRNLSLYGYRDPSLTMYVPYSPRGFSWPV